ncbi:MAG: hypothetical protein ACK6EB_27710 [Planctomyces sp.]
MSGKYYAIADVGGPVSVRIYADSASLAAVWFAAQKTNFADAGRTDAEDDLEIEGDGMDSADFADAMGALGWSPMYLDICDDRQWSLWGKV